MRNMAKPRKAAAHVSRVLDAVDEAWKYSTPPHGFEYSARMRTDPKDQEEPIFWLITVWPSMGRKPDGSKVHGTFFMNTDLVAEVFDESPKTTFFAGRPDGKRRNAAVLIEGKVDGEEVWLHIFQSPPDDAEPTFEMDESGGWKEIAAQ